MKTIKIFSLIIVVCGMILLTLGLLSTKGDFTSLWSAFNYDYKYEIVNQQGEEIITSVDINVTTNNISFFKSEDDTYSADYYVADDDQIAFSIEAEKLIIKSIYKHKMFNFGFKTKEISAMNIYLPNSFNGIIKCKTTTGKIIIANFGELEELNLNVTTGDISVSNTTVIGDLTFNTTTGRVDISSVITPKIRGYSTTGNVNVSDSTITNEIRLNSTTGNIKLSNIETNSINCNSTTGKINLLKIKSDSIIARATTGSIEVNVSGIQEDYRVSFATTTGTSKFQGVKYSGQTLNHSGTKIIEINTTTGNIAITIST